MSPEVRPPIRIGVVGCGRIARRVHLPELARSADFVVVALADPDPASLRAASGLVPEARTHSEPAELLASGGLDAVLIASPPATHAELAIDAFAHELNVYVEKPVAVSPEEGRSIVAAWKASRRIGVVGFNYRFSPVLLEARRLVAEGTIGPLAGVRSVFTSAPRAQSLWKHNRSSGGGALLDLGSHHLDGVPFVLDREVAEVSAHLSSRRFEADTAAVQLLLVDGTPCQSLFMIGTRNEDRLEIYGNEGKIVVDRLEGSIELLPPHAGGSGPERALHHVASGLGNARRALAHDSEPSFPAALEGFADAIRRRGEAGASTAPAADIEAGLRSLELADAAERSAREGTSVTLRPLVIEPPIDPEPGPSDRASASIAATAPAPTATDGARPDLSVILVTADRWDQIQRTLEHLGRQTVKERIELLIVAPEASSLDGLPDGLLAGYHSVETIPAGPIDNVDVAAAHGIRRARSHVVAMVEDHAFPELGWAAAIIEAHEEPWGVVGSAFTNANPRSLLSWVNMLMAYGSWIVPVSGGQVGSVSRHNVSFKRAALMKYDADLERLLGRDGGLLQRLAADGHRSFLASDARLAHVNPSRLLSTVRLRINAGRLRAAGRAARGRWPGWKRFVYVAGSPLIPVMLFRGMFRDYFSDQHRRPLMARAVPALAIGTTLDAIGQMVGFALGAGSAADTLAAFEFERARHLRRGDRRALNG